MKAYKAVLVLLSIICVGHLSHGFKMNPKVELPPQKDSRVLVIGASGDVGNLVSMVLPGGFARPLCCGCSFILVLQALENAGARVLHTAERFMCW